MFDFDINFDPARSDLNRLRDRLDDLSQLVRQLTDLQHQMTLEDYESQVSPDGSGWDSGPYYHGLVESGDMWAGIVPTYGGDTGTITATDWKSKYHQGGTDVIPARPFIGIGDRHMQRLKQLTEQYITKLL